MQFFEFGMCKHCYGLFFSMRTWVFKGSHGAITCKDAESLCYIKSTMLKLTALNHTERQI